MTKDNVLEFSGRDTISEPRRGSALPADELARGLICGALYLAGLLLAENR